MSAEDGRWAVMQECIEPGHWVIEGQTIKRFRVRPGGIRWRVVGGPEFRTLAEAREWAVDERDKPYIYPEDKQEGQGTGRSAADPNY